MAKESTQKKIARIRAPRVQIEYEVEIDGAMVLKELPFVVGVLGDFSGKPSEQLPKLKDRKFVEIDRDNFDKVLAGCKPRLAFRVDDKLSGKADTQLNVELKFGSLEDFEPANVAKQVEPLRKLLETRDKLKNLLNKMEGNDKAMEMFDEILKNSDQRDRLLQELGMNQTPEKPE
ncbi:MAG TPA: type VI secretion system contractile sheath small subunit [Pirellulales bacterium]|jgi:type VI secretion system protein ImpB|nr:type VI secretion system contractile sheath small subunit [Pirellulales bacterium]